MVQSSYFMVFLCCVLLFGFGGFEDRASSFEYRKVAFGWDVDHGLVVEVGLSQLVKIVGEI